MIGVTSTFSLLRAERARTPGRATWVSVLGLVLVPVLVGGLLTWALWKPTERLDRMTAAVVNLDKPVTVAGQMVPLGRQLASALVTSAGAAEPAATSPGSARAANVSGSDSAGNFTWVLTDAKDAASGLAAGTYATVVTIPPAFSAAATSSAGSADDAVQATIDIATSGRSRLVDAAVSQAVTDTAIHLLNTQLTSTYLDRVLVGFTTLHDGLGQAADGAAALASGAGDLGTGASQLADGTTGLADGVSALGSGAGTLATGVHGIADGAGSLASGLSQLASQTSASASTASASAGQVAAFTQGLDALVTGVNGPGGLAQGAAGLSAGAAGLRSGLSSLLQTLDTSATACAAGDQVACGTVSAIIDAQQDATAPAAGQQPTVMYSAGALAAGAAGLDAAVSTGTATAPALSTSVSRLAAGGHQLADGVTASASGLGTLAGYLRQSADGAATLASGARSAAAGADSLAGGAADAAVGAGALSSGAGQVAAGVGSLAAGATQLASGLSASTSQVPTYTADQATRLADVVATPVTARSADDAGLFGSTSVPFLAALALWLGGLASFVVLGAVPRRALGSTRSSVALALGAFAPGALVGAVQGLALSAVLGFALDLSAGGWAAFTVLAVLAGVAFAAVNQGLVAVFGGVGRFIAVLVAVVGLAGAVVSTVPALVVDLFTASPLSAALHGLQGVVTGESGAGTAAAALVVWTVVGVAAATAAVGRRRVVPAGQLARWSRAT